MSKEWDQSLCGCISEPSTCLMVWCCNPCAYATLKTHVYGGGYFPSCLYMFCCPLCACLCSHPDLRAQIRRVKGTPESPCNDCLTSCYCLACAMCQELKEINAPPCGNPDPSRPVGIVNQGGTTVVVQQVVQPAGQAPPPQ